jgi:hypothetical protein
MRSNTIWQTRQPLNLVGVPPGRIAVALVLCCKSILSWRLYVACAHIYLVLA